MFRAVLSVGLCVTAFGLGMLTVILAARNRQRAADLDELHRWCELYARQNELLRVRIEAEEWKLLGGEADELPEVER